MCTVPYLDHINLMAAKQLMLLSLQINYSMSCVRSIVIWLLLFAVSIVQMSHIVYIHSLETIDSTNSHLRTHKMMIKLHIKWKVLLLLNVSPQA